MPAETDATAALDLIERDGFRTGLGWAKAHVITQAHEGTPLFDAIHAFLHRIEGDLPNAAYWDRRSGSVGLPWAAWSRCSRSPLSVSGT